MRTLRNVNIAVNISFLQCGPSSLVDRYQQYEGTSQLQVQLLVW